MRTINDIFINDLTKGSLRFFLEQVKDNRNELSLEIRNGYINIYYKGGNLLKITQKKNGYSFFFDTKYCLNKDEGSNYQLLKNLPKDDIEQHVQHFKLLKDEMDTWFKKYQKLERDYQHNLLVANPCIIDIEYQIRNILRLDMLMYADGKLYIVENKYGIGAIGGKSGIKDHYEKICQVLSTPQLYSELVDSIYHISKAKKELGLRNEIIQREDISGAEILFLFANYNPNSTSLEKAVESIEARYPAKILMMDGDEFKIELSKAKDMFGYGN